MFKITTATKKVKALSKRIRAVQGGTSASKTISILLMLIDTAQRDTEPTLTSIVSESLPHLKRGAIRDFLNIMKAHNYYDDDLWNRSDFTYTFETGSKIEFFSADQPSKTRGPRRQRLFLNECNNLPLETFEQLEVRTSEYIYLDWNPTIEFWFYQHVVDRDDVDHIILTYKDNEGLPESIVQAIEQRKSNKSWWKVYGEGQLGEVEGRVFKGWTILDELPPEAKLVYRGLDFGYTNDPTAIIDIYKWNDSLILDEIMYRKGLSNKAIADILLAQETDILTVADSSEPKSIDEIKMYGCNIVGATKGAGSISQGVAYLQDQKVFMTKRSANLIREYRNYMFVSDKSGKITNTPEDFNNHAMDASRYGVSLMSLKKEQGEYIKSYDDDYDYQPMYPDINI